MTNVPVCFKGGTCQVTSRNRKCTACRFRKCVEAGMCRKNIKTGRYSYLKRLQDITKLKQTQNIFPTPPSPPEQEKKQQQQQVLAAEGHVSLMTLPQCVMPLSHETNSQRSHVSLTDCAYKEQLVSALKQAQHKVLEGVTPRHILLTSLDPCDAVASDDVYIRWLNRSFTENHWSLFIKAIPGFRDLSLCDQIELIKRKRLYFLESARTFV